MKSIKKSIPNALSLLRGGSAFVIPFISYKAILLVLCIAAITDLADGFFARKWSSQTVLGTLLDPAADKLVALFCAYRFFTDQLLQPAVLPMLFARDISLILFTSFLLISGRWPQWKIYSCYCSKASTTLQACSFLSLIFLRSIPASLLCLLILFGCGSMVELGNKLASLAECGIPSQSGVPMQKPAVQKE